MKQRAMLRSCALVIALLAMGAMASSGDVIVKPSKHTDNQVAVIFIQGADIKPKAYIPLAEAIQAASPYGVWFGIPEFPLDAPNPVTLGSGVARIQKALVAAGMNVTAQRSFVAGHSLGGAMVVDYTYSHASDFVGQILMGSFITRKYANKTYPVPTLTIGGELDGLCRVSRIAEGSYRYRNFNASSLPVVVLPGVSHMQFASGVPPSNVRKHDLQPEVTYQQAHAMIAKTFSAFMNAKLGNTTSLQYIQKLVDETKAFVAPIVNGLLYEGFYHFTPPCNNNGFKDFPCTANCLCGSQHVENAQAYMGGLKAPSAISVSDKFHVVWQVTPTVHLPRVWNNCSGKTSCRLNVSTVSENVHSKLDSFDTGFYPTAAQEVRAKLVSRQNVYQHSVNPTAAFNTTDGPSLCAEINQQTYEWALKNAGAETLARYNSKGQKLTMGADKLVVGGPAWIWGPLQYNNKNSTSGPCEITSIAQKSPMKYIIPLAAGFHYCKLLSPAMAMEWIYIDGLRARLSLGL